MSIARSVARSVARPVASSPIRGGGAGGEPPEPSILGSVGTFTSPASTGTQDIALPFEAKAFVPFGALVTADGAAAGLNLGFGAMTAAAQAAISVSSINGVTTSNTDRRHDNADVVSIITDGTTIEEAARSAIAADKVTLNWTTAAAAANIFNRVAIGGSALEVSLTQHQMNGTNAAQSFAHGLTGGAPTGLVLFSAREFAGVPLTSLQLEASLGVWAGADQFGTVMFSRNAVTTTQCRRWLSSVGVLGRMDQSPAGLRRLMSISSVDSSSVNVTYPVSEFAAENFFWAIAIRGAKCKVAAFDCNGSLDSLTIDCTSITPRLCLFLFVPSGVDSSNTLLNGSILTLGASDGTNNASSGISDANGVTTTNARRSHSSTTLCEYDTAGTKVFEATAAFSGESVVIDPTVNSGTTHGQGAVLIIGE